jgi:hypothetical protein
LGELREHLEKDNPDLSLERGKSNDHPERE